LRLGAFPGGAASRWRDRRRAGRPRSGRLIAGYYAPSAEPAGPHRATKGRIPHVDGAGPHAAAPHNDTRSGSRCAAAQFQCPAASIIVVRQDRAAKGPTVWRCALETMIGIGVLLVGIGILWVCFAIGVWFFTRTGREGMRIQRMQADRWREQAQEE
jgi:hypothetical protein